MHKAYSSDDTLHLPYKELSAHPQLKLHNHLLQRVSYPLPMGVTISDDVT